MSDPSDTSRASLDRLRALGDGIFAFAMGGARLAQASPRLEALRKAAVARILAPVAL